MKTSEYERKQRQDAEKRRKEREAEEQWYINEALGLQQQPALDSWMRGDYG